MRIGCFVPVVSRLPGYERNVSGHIQIPLYAMAKLGERGHEMHLITNEFEPGERVMPWCLPQDITTHYIIDSRIRRGALEKKRVARYQPKGVYPVAMLRQLRQFKRIVQESKLDLLHLCGFSRLAPLGAILRYVGIRVPILLTPYGGPTSRDPVSKFLLRRAGLVTCGTHFIADRWRDAGLKARVVRHGLVRDLKTEEGFRDDAERFRVLFWRAFTTGNGGDIALETFDQLAPEFPDVSFDLAIRPTPNELPGADDLAAKHENVHVHRFPYPPGTTLAGLVSESICILLPFRALSFHPQLAIGESLAAGVAVVATNLSSTPELLEDSRHGRLVPAENVPATVDAVRWMLQHREQAIEMGCLARRDIEANWTWDRFADEMTDIYSELVDS